MPTKIIFGANEIDNISQYTKDYRVFLLISNSLVKNGIADKIQNKCRNLVGIFSEIKSHPEFCDLELAHNKIHSVNFDMILAIGGGSVMDSAKFFALRDKDPKNITKMIKNANKPNCEILPLICIPSTAGTGSELTPWATIWDMSEKKKYSLHLQSLFSKVAIYDPYLTISLPKNITIQTALDALSHSLESIWNKNANEITIQYGIKSAKIIMEFLPKLINDLGNLEFRSKILQACMYSAMAFSNTQTSIAHAMSYYITIHKNIPHGIACSFTLPMIIDRIIGKFEFIDNAIKDIFGELSSKPLQDMLNLLQISTKFEDYDLTKDEVMKNMSNNVRAGNFICDIKNFLKD